MYKKFRSPDFMDGGGTSIDYQNIERPGIRYVLDLDSSNGRTSFLPHPRYVQLPEIVIGPKVFVETLRIREHVEWHVQHAVRIYMPGQLVKMFVIEIHVRELSNDNDRCEKAAAAATATGAYFVKS